MTSCESVARYNTKGNIDRFRITMPTSTKPAEPKVPNRGNTIMTMATIIRIMMIAIATIATIPTVQNCVEKQNCAEC